MISDIDNLIDKLVPRGGDKPDAIHTSLEEYLGRLSSLNRKISGTKYRMQSWQTICQDHKSEFKKRVNSLDLLKMHENATFKSLTITFSSTDVRVENEFEMLLYSLISTLNTLTRVIACFLKGSTQIHSHSKLPDILLKHADLKSCYRIAFAAANSWAGELTIRRDAATHYIALLTDSTIKHSKAASTGFNTTILHVGIPKVPTKHISIWTDQLPTKGGSKSTIMHGTEGEQLLELRDHQENLIVQREQPLQPVELIDGEQYIGNVYESFKKYIIEILNLLLVRINNIA